MAKDNLKQNVELYDPHPGFAGAAVPLPKPMKEFADKLDGQNMTLEEALDKLSPIAEDIGGSVCLIDKFKYIGFTYVERGGREHFFRLIRYK